MGSVLVVEDDPDLRDIERAFLEFRGFSVTVARNGAEALGSLERDRPNVILLDLMMPVMDGLAFLTERKRRGIGSTIPVVCVSAAGREFMAEALRLGASECLAKPADLDTLCECVSRYCSTDGYITAADPLHASR